MATAQDLLTAAETAYLNLLTGGYSSVSFNGKTFTHHNLTELANIRDRLRAEVQTSTRRSGPFKGVDLR